MKQQTSPRRRATVPVKGIVRTPSSRLIFKPQTFAEYLENKPKSQLVAITADAREFGLNVIHAEYEEFEDVREGRA